MGKAGELPGCESARKTAEGALQAVEKPAQPFGDVPVAFLGFLQDRMGIC